MKIVTREFMERARAFGAAAAWGWCGDESPAFPGQAPYRYALARCWRASGPLMAWIMCNPSKASEDVTDPTVAGCIDRAKAADFSGILVANVFALRSPYPKHIDEFRARGGDPVGPDNDEAIAEVAMLAQTVVVAWGVDGMKFDRGAAVLAALERADFPLYCLGRTKDGAPRHPLYVRRAQPLERFP